jgi:dihydrofolate reductase
VSADVLQRGASVEFVVAVAENDVIGRDNGLPWRLSADLRHFKAVTLGHNVLMGRRTFESIGKPLPGRRNIVLTRSADFAAAGCTVAHTLEQSLLAAGPGAPLMVIGGAEVFQLALPLARRIHLTIVHTLIADGDTFFDGWRNAAWREVAREYHEADDKNSYAYSFVTLERDQSALTP